MLWRVTSIQSPAFARSINGCGIAQHYKPEELIGKQVLFIANLAPRQFKNGLVSEGMILSAENFDGTLAVTSLLREVKPGSEVK